MHCDPEIYTLTDVPVASLSVYVCVFVPLLFIGSCPTGKDTMQIPREVYSLSDSFSAWLISNSCS